MFPLIFDRSVCDVQSGTDSPSVVDSLRYAASMLETYVQYYRAYEDVNHFSAMLSGGDAQTTTTMHSGPDRTSAFGACVCC